MIDAEANVAVGHPPPTLEGESGGPQRGWARILGPLPSAAPAWRIRLNELFEGITPTIIAIAAIVCLADAIQDVLHTVLRRPLGHSASSVLKGFYSAALIALLFVFGVVAALNRHPVPGLRQTIAVVVAVVLAAVIGSLLQLHWLGLLYVRAQVEGGFYYSDAMSHAIQRFVRYLTIGALFAASFTMYRRERLRNESLHQNEIAQAQLGQQLDEARLQALSAQIEPHFLFNTLANVRSLYQSNAAAAERMLDNLTTYLAVALPRMRESDSTIGREAALAEAYLGIQQIRMGKRLAFSIHIPANLQLAALPPMMLLTLVENAVKHGLGRLPEGGTITIMVTEDAGLVSVRVADTGCGFAKQLGNGAGLANIRARLAALYGAFGRLHLGLNAPHGVTATIVVPVSGARAH